MQILDPSTTVLILIDLQKGIMARELSPYSSVEIIGRAKEVAGVFRKAGALVVLVNVAFSKDRKDALQQPVDQQAQMPSGPGAENFSDLVEGLFVEGDVRITKKQWGAFFGTELDLQLRRRGIKTIVLGGVATNMGVESTARSAYEHGYALVIAEDLCSSSAEEIHNFPIKNIFPRLSRVVKAADISF